MSVADYSDTEMFEALRYAVPLIRRQKKPKMDAYELPSQWAQDCITMPHGMTFAPYQLDIMDNVFIHKRESARGPHTIGKTTTSALTICYAILKFEAEARADRVGDWKVITTASYWRQLEKYLWPSIRMWWRRIRWDKVGMEPFKNVTLMGVRTSYGEAFAVDPINFEGAHADLILVVNDESKDIPAVTWEKEEGIFAGAGDDVFQTAYQLAVSTPGPMAGTFYDIQSAKPGYEDWHRTHVTAEQAIEAGRMSPTWREQRRRQWGEDSAVYQNRVEGNFYAQESIGVIPLTWIEAANRRWLERKEAGDVPATLSRIGVDLADQGEDATIFAPMYGDDFVDRLRELRKERPRGIVSRLYRVLSKMGGIAFVDVLPNGGAIVDWLRELAVEAQTFNGSEAAKYHIEGREMRYQDRTGHFTFANRRAHALWNLRELLDPEYDPTLALPPDDELIGDLTTPMYEVTSTGAIRVESKEKFKGRLGRSPDKGDAVMICCYPHEIASDESLDASGVVALVGV